MSRQYQFSIAFRLEQNAAIRVHSISMTISRKKYRLSFLFPVCLFFLISIRAVGIEIISGDGKEKLRIENYLIYRQAAVQLRKESDLFNTEKDRDYIDQIYLTLRMIKEYPDVAIATVEPAFYSFRENPGQVTFRIDQANIDATLFDKVHLIVGKRVETRGSGNFFSPSDLLNEDQDFIDPLVRREGKNLSRIEWRSPTLKVGIGYIPSVSRPWRDGRLWGLAEFSLWDADLGFQFTHNDDRKTTAGFSAVRFFGDTVEVHLDGKVQSRLNSMSSQPEREYSSIPDDASGHQLIIGNRYVLTPSLSFVAEYIKNSVGANPGELSQYFAAQRQRKDENLKPADPFSRLVGREYAAVAVYDDKLFSKLRASVSGIHNLRDASTLASINLRYRASSLVTCGYSPLFFLGDRRSEFGENSLKSIQYFTIEGMF